MRSLLDWLDNRTGYRAVLHHLLEEPIPKGIGLGVHHRQRAAVPPRRAAPHRRRADDVLRAGAADGLRQRALHHQHAAARVAAARPALTGAPRFIVLAAAIHLLRVFFFGSYKAPREVTWLTGVTLFLLDPRVLAERLPAAVGPEGVLGDDGHDQHCARHAAHRRAGGAGAPRRQPARRADARPLVQRARLPAAGRAHRLRRRAHRADAPARHLRTDSSRRRDRRPRSIRGT